MDESILDSWVPSKIFMKVTTKSATMNAYVYDTKSRSVPGLAAKAGNAQAQTGDIFAVNPKSGLLAVFYNSDATDGQFGFEYWVEATKKGDD